MNNINIDELQNAIDMAEKYHRSQTIKGSERPYIIHCLKVLAETQNSLYGMPGADIRLGALCAVLHDTLEDTDINPDIMIDTFGIDVMEGVQAMTKDDSLPEEIQLKDSLQRIASGRLEIMVLKMCDRIVNLAPPPDFWTKEKILSYYNDSIEIYNTLGHADEYTASRLMSKIRFYKQYLK